MPPPTARSADPGAQPAPAPDPALIGARIQAVQQPDESTVVLETHQAGPGTARWLFSVRAESARLGRTFARSRRGGPPPVFCQWLRTRLEGGRVEALRLRQPQVLELVIATGEVRHHLLLELNRRDSNLLLLDGEERLLIALRHPSLPGRTLGPGEPYRPPPSLHAWPRSLPLAERYPGPDEAAARALERTWQAREAAAELDARRRPAQQLVRRERKRLQRRLAKLDAEQADALAAERWKRRGELLQIHRARLRAGMSEVRVPDVFEPGQPEVTIALDPQADPGRNIERCFRQYRKHRAAGPHVAGRIAGTRAEDEAWRALGEHLERAEGPAALEALAAALEPGALGGRAAELRRLLRGEAPAGSGAGAPAPPQGPMRRRSADGYTILVGRSAEENDRVTFRLGQGRDWWFHAQGIPGSHVIVRNPGGDALPPRTLREAAWLAGYYSQARAAGRVDVDYAQRKHVRKVKGGLPGQVTYSQSRTLLVPLEDAELRQVLAREDAEPA
jgi:predicted ribosome quality control (RQC) complex YloA/Tae2 family protein